MEQHKQIHLVISQMTVFKHPVQVRSIRSVICSDAGLATAVKNGPTRIIGCDAISLIMYRKDFGSNMRAKFLECPGSIMPLAPLEFRRNMAEELDTPVAQLYVARMRLRK